jgi:hypothetical protein
MLANLFFPHGIPGHIRPDNGSGFIAAAVMITAVGAKTAYSGRRQRKQIAVGTMRPVSEVF